MYRIFFILVLLSTSLFGCAQDLSQRRALRYRPMVSPQDNLIEIYWDTPVGRSFRVVDFNRDTGRSVTYDAVLQDNQRISSFNIPILQEPGSHIVHIHFFQSKLYFLIFSYIFEEDFE